MTSIDRAFMGDNRLRKDAASAGGRDPLPRLLAQLMERADGPATVERATSRPWASALFQGRRHVVALRILGSDAAERRARFVAGIEEAEWTLSGHFVADLSIDASRSDGAEEWIELSALTIEEW